MLRFILINIFIFILGFINTQDLNASNLDSIGVRSINGVLYTMHKVEAKETFYSISRRYNADVKELMRVNPRENNALEIDDIVFVPQKSSSQLSPKSENKYHVVRPKETVYSISKLYQVSPEQIIEWNQIVDNAISVGQELIVTADPAKLDLQRTSAPKIKRDTISTKDELEVLMQGVIGIDSNLTDPVNPFVALHRSAALGSVIQIKNPSNNKVVYAKVVGKLPETYFNEGMIMRLNTASFSVLGVKTIQFTGTTKTKTAKRP